VARGNGQKMASEGALHQFSGERKKSHMKGEENLSCAGKNQTLGKNAKQKKGCGVRRKQLDEAPVGRRGTVEFVRKIRVHK